MQCCAVHCSNTCLEECGIMLIMAIQVVEFSNGGYKIRKIFAKNQHTQRKLLNFENWVNGEVSKIGHHFSK